jgi:hypothetical protein
MFRTSLLIALTVWIAGCAHPPGSFRLTSPASAVTLVPPEAKDVTVVRATVRLTRIPRKTVCSPSPHGLFVERKGSTGARLVVTREALASTTSAELFSWALGLEKQGCIPANEAFRLAENVVDALPLDLAKRQRLLRGRGDLKPVNSLRVVAPVLKPGTSGNLAETTSVTQGANPGSLEVEVRSNPGVIGYEIDWYDLAGQASGPGFRIVPRSAEIHVDGKVEHPTAPTSDRFQFGTAARWYELYMMTKVSANDFDFVVFSARSSEELQNSVAAFQRDATEYLKTADPTSYAVLPHGSGINAYIRVKVNADWLDLPRGNSVMQAIVEASGDPVAVLPVLKVRKLHDGKLYPVEWDRRTRQILSLPLEGGEEISW